MKWARAQTIDVFSFYFHEFEPSRLLPVNSNVSLTLIKQAPVQISKSQPYSLNKKVVFWT